MLHENPLMIDIDVDQWRNLHERFLTSAKEKKRIIIIHEGGEILKFIHSDGKDVIKTINKVINPQRDAKKVYDDNKGKADFVLVLERKAVERFFAGIQDSWSAEEDLDEYVYRMYSKLDEYKDEIVTYPGPARENLGLRWRLTMSYPQVKEVVQRYIPPNSVLVVGIFENSNLIWGSLVLGFDEKRKIKLITTIDKSQVTRDWKEEYKQVVRWVEEKFWKCSLGLFMDRDSVETILESGKLETLRDLIRGGKLIAYPVPEILRQQLAWLNLHPIG